MIKIDYDEIASRIANCSKVSDCQDIFKNWESLSNPLKLDLSKKYIDLAIDVNKVLDLKFFPLVEINFLELWRKKQNQVSKYQVKKLQIH